LIDKILKKITIVKTKDKKKNIVGRHIDLPHKAR
jgi:hypothetical protein